jgi:hypothetical protein
MDLIAGASTGHGASDGQRIDWRLCWLQAALYAATQTVFSTTEGIRYVVEEGAVRDISPLLMASFVIWLASGVALAAVAQWAWGTATRTLLGGVVVLTASAVHSPANAILLQILVRAYFPEADVPLVPILYMFWIGTLGGGLFFGYCTLVQRSVSRSRELAHVDIERTDLEARLRQARTAFLERSVDPALLERSLAALRAAHARDSKGSAALLDQLVEFLRLAMPAVREGCGVRTDVATQRAWNQLRERLDNMNQADASGTGTNRQTVIDKQGEQQ